MDFDNDGIFEGIKKTFRSLFAFLRVLLFLLPVLIAVFAIITLTSLDRNDRSVFGLKFFIVQSDSMSLSENNKDMNVHFNAGDIVIVQKVEDATNFAEGDVIAFVSTSSESYMKTVTHMIREVKMDEAGNVIGYVTFGTHKGTNDSSIVAPDRVLGKYAGKIPEAGNFFAFLKSPEGYVKCIFIPFLILVLFYSLRISWYHYKCKKLEEEMW